MSKEVLQPQPTLEQAIDLFLAAASGNDRDKKGKAAKQVLQAIKAGGDPTPYENLYDDLADASDELLQHLKTNHHYVSQAMLSNAGNEHAVQRIAAIPQNAQTPAQNVIADWSRRAGKPGIPQVLRRKLMEMADAIEQGTEQSSHEQLEAQLTNTYQTVMDTSWNKLISGEMKTYKKQALLLYTTTQTGVSLKKNERASDYQRSRDGATSYLKSQGIPEEKTTAFLTKLKETHPSLLFTLGEVQDAMLIADSHLLLTRAETYRDIDEGYLSSLRQRNQDAVAASRWIRGAALELSGEDVSIEQWFTRHKDTLKQHETTLLQNLQKDYNELPQVTKREEILRLVCDQLETLGVDQTAERQKIEAREKITAANTAWSTKKQPEQPAAEEAQKPSRWQRIKTTMARPFKRFRSEIRHDPVISAPFDVNREHGMDTENTQAIGGRFTAHNTNRTPEQAVTQQVQDVAEARGKAVEGSKFSRLKLRIGAKKLAASYAEQHPEDGKETFQQEAKETLKQGKKAPLRGNKKTYFKADGNTMDKDEAISSSKVVNQPEVQELERDWSAKQVAEQATQQEKELQEAKETHQKQKAERSGRKSPLAKGLSEKIISGPRPLSRQVTPEELEAHKQQHEEKIKEGMNQASEEDIDNVIDDLLDHMSPVALGVPSQEDLEAQQAQAFLDQTAQEYDQKHPGENAMEKLDDILAKPARSLEDDLAQTIQELGAMGGGKWPGEELPKPAERTEEEINQDFDNVMNEYGLNQPQVDRRDPGKKALRDSVNLGLVNPENARDPKVKAKAEGKENEPVGKSVSPDSSPDTGKTPINYRS